MSKSKDYFFCKARYLELDIPYPYEAMLEEARRLSHRFVPHRGSESEGWESLTLHGLGEDKTGIFRDYGYAHGGDARKDMFWTPAAHESPITMSFLQNNYPSKLLGRVRFMKLKAGGYIGLHSDSSKPIVDNINLVLNNPKECVWYWEDGSSVDMKPGVAYGMNIHYQHTIRNESKEDRYHMIITSHEATDEWKKLLTDAANKIGETGEFVSLDFLP
jgi:hypothetical protein